MKGSNQASDVEAFLEAHPTGPFAVQAETLLAALTPVPGTAPSAGPKATPGDRARGLALLERAVDTAESIGDPKIRVYATGYLIDELFRQGRPAAVRRLATSVQNAFAAIGENREYYVGILAQVLVVAGNEGEALGLADQYSDQRDSILQSISEGLAVRGDFEAALRKSDQIGDIEYRGWALRDIARQVMKGGDTQRALRIVNRMSDADDRAMELTVISDAQRKAGDMTGAGRNLAMAEDALRAAAASDRSSVLNALVEGYSALGDRSAAERILGDLRALPSRLAEDIEREFAQNRLASAEALLGDFNGARRIANSIADADYRKWALRDIAGAFAKAGRYDEALDVAGGIADDWAKTLIAEEMAKAGLVERAVAVADGIGSGYPRSVAYSSIAEILLDPPVAAAAR